MLSTKRDHVRSNLKLYDEPDIAETYKVDTTAQLLKGEIAIISRVKAEFSGKRILDIGVGGGRTTTALLDISNRYIGVDVASSMISECRERFPSVSFEICDARDLSRFENGSFDLVFFSFNGIDSIDHKGRLEVIREIYRVLTQGGAFAFSSHNLRTYIGRPWRSTKLLTINPFRHPRCYSRRVIKVFVETVNHIRNRQYERYHNGFAIINDGAHNYRSLHYYVNAETQAHQLNEVGFTTVEVVDRNGRWLMPKDYLICKDIWLHYLCRKS